MNQDNSRLREIQIFKAAYNRKLNESDSISECLILQEHIDELTREEKEILERFDVIT